MILILITYTIVAICFIFGLFFHSKEYRRLMMLYYLFAISVCSTLYLPLFYIYKILTK